MIFALIEEHRHFFGRVVLLGSILTLGLAVLSDVILFASPKNPLFAVMVARFPKLLVLLLKTDLIGCLLFGFLSFFAEGRYRAFGLATSLATFFLCAPLGVGY